jgi:hypothetical protein
MKVAGFATELTMRLHDKIKTACAEAAPIVASAANGTESGIYHLNHHVADLCAFLCREMGGFREALAQRGVRVTIDPPPRPNKAA